MSVRLGTTVKKIRKSPHAIYAYFGSCYQSIMNEELLQFIWRFQYFQTGNLYSTHGERVKIIRPGDWNRNQGPDFLAASVFVGQTQWVGNIEIHVLASDWHKHNHQKDERYSGIILHVVWKNDVTIKDNYGNDIPTVVLESHVPKILLDRYEKLMQAKQPILCAGFLPFLDELSWGAWKERLMVERLERKAGLILQQLQKLKGDWEELSWQKLTANFGIKVNEPVFEQLAASLPFKRLIKHRTNRLDIEALLYGQSNLLKRIYTDSYPVDLLNVYSFLSKKIQAKAHPTSACISAYATHWVPYLAFITTGSMDNPKRNHFQYPDGS